MAFPSRVADFSHGQPLRQPPRAPPNPCDLTDDDFCDEEVDEFPEFGNMCSIDGLSKITEGSHETRTDISSVFFSAISSKCPSKMSKRTVPSVFSGLIQGGNRSSQNNLPTPARALATKQHNTQSAGNVALSEMMNIVKVFVEAAVRGFVAEAICGNGHVRPVVFRLSRKVDAFELIPCDGGASCKVLLLEVSKTFLGSERRLKDELGPLHQHLDANCAVLELLDGRYLALNLRGCSWAERGLEAQTFIRCMHTFVSELQRQGASV
jgi:hypothetical protein